MRLFVLGVVRLVAAVVVIVPLAAATVAVTALADRPGELAGFAFPGPPPPAVEPTDPSVAPPAEPPPAPPTEAPPPDWEPVHWRRSTALGTHAAGRLVNGVRLPAEGPAFFTWDPVLRRSPDRPWRRWGTDRLVRVVLRVARAYREAHPEVARLAVGDLSRPHGGDFGPRFGYIGHLSHQNGLDADIYYPRKDGLERAPRHVTQIDRELSQELVDRFLAAGAQVIFIGPNTGLTGPPEQVQALVHHDNHLHVRLP